MNLFSLTKFSIFSILLVSMIVVETNAQRTCGTEAHMEHLMQDAEFAQEYQAKMHALNASTHENRGFRACPNPVILPMAVHYQGLGNNIDQACLIDLAERQIQILNDDYSGSNSDITKWTNGASGSFPGVSNGETCVQFCLATQGHPANYNLTEGQPAVTFDATTGDSAPGFSGYINIFVRTVGGGILGYSPLGGQGNGDGVVIDRNNFSKAPGCSSSGVNPISPFNLGRTLTHELGHYLGLSHVWGNQGGCNDDDFVNDTPNSLQPYYGCNIVGASSCSTIDMHMNYMDYSDDECMYMFTAGQANRMESYVNQFLGHVEDNYEAKCVFVPQAPVAAISIPADAGCAPFSVNFSDNSGGIPTSWQWSFPGGTPSSSTEQYPPTVVYETPGTYTATLAATNDLGTDQVTMSVEAIDCSTSPCITLNHMNGGTPTLIDAVDSQGQPQGGYISGHNGFGDVAKAEYFDDFGSFTQINGVEFDFGFATGTGDVDFFVWTSNNGQPGAKIGNASIPVSTIISDVNANVNTFVDFGVINVNITGPFYVGFELSTDGSNEIAVNTNSNGETSPTNSWEQWGDNSWHSFNDGTNNTWQADIALAIYPDVCTSGVVSVDEIEGITGINAFPNPAKDELTIEVNAEKPTSFNLDVYDVIGRNVMILGEKNIDVRFTETFDISKLETGTYFIRMTDGNQTTTRKFLKL